MHEEQYNESVVQHANKLGLSVESVHMTPLVSGCSSNGARICADKVKDAMLGYSDTDSSDEIDRYQYCEPDTVVFHPPRLPSDDTAELDFRRQQLIATLGNATLQLQKTKGIEEAPTITIENVCPRGSFTYLLTESTDVNRLESAHAQLQAKQKA
ncbi:hypothetical protein [Haloferax marisrubri]|nr:hypothetical protein [Haloferax marisrubri]